MNIILKRMRYMRLSEATALVRSKQIWSVHAFLGNQTHDCGVASSTSLYCLSYDKATQILFRLFVYIHKDHSYVGHFYVSSSRQSWCLAVWESWCIFNPLSTIESSWVWALTRFIYVVHHPIHLNSWRFTLKVHGPNKSILKCIEGQINDLSV